MLLPEGLVVTITKKTRSMRFFVEDHYLVHKLDALLQFWYDQHYLDFFVESDSFWKHDNEIFDCFVHFSLFSNIQISLAS